MRDFFEDLFIAILMLTVGFGFGALSERHRLGDELCIKTMEKQ